MFARMHAQNIYFLQSIINTQKDYLVKCQTLLVYTAISGDIIHTHTAPVYFNIPYSLSLSLCVCAGMEG